MTSSNINKHKFFLTRILKDIYSDVELAPNLGFKGGTAMMFFYDLPRFSVDLDFNLLNPDKEQAVFSKVKDILLQYGTIHDEQIKHYGPLLVLNYGAGEWNMKVEISNRSFSDHYEVKDLLGINMQVMTAPDMFAHKLCALLDRKQIANRDIFDSWYFMSRNTPINPEIVEKRMEMPLADYFQKCIDKLNSIGDKGLLNGLGELLDEDMKKFVRTKLRSETIQLMKFYKEFPILWTPENHHINKNSKLTPGMVRKPFRRKM